MSGRLTGLYSDIKLDLLRARELKCIKFDLFYYYSMVLNRDIKHKISPQETDIECVCPERSLAVKHDGSGEYKPNEMNRVKAGCPLQHSRSMMFFVAICKVVIDTLTVFIPALHTLFSKQYGTRKHAYHTYVDGESCMGKRL